MLMDNRQDFILFHLADTDEFQCLSSTTIRADKSLIVESGKGQAHPCIPVRTWGKLPFYFQPFSFPCTSFADCQCFHKESRLETKMSVADKASLHICSAGNAQLSFFVHDIHKGLHRFGFAIFQSLHGQFYFRLVVETWITLVGIKFQLITLRNFPDCNRNGGAFFLFNGKV